MKRRNAEFCKMRRTVKRTRITEEIYGSSLVYLKFVMLWASVVTVDYMLEFRFEFLWPVWMMLKSIYDSYKYQGLAFSFFFVCITVTSDMICFCFVPLQYVFFMASTYVWVQYVWFSCGPGWGGVVLALGAAALQAGGPAHCGPLAAATLAHALRGLAAAARARLCQRIRVHWQIKMREHNEAHCQFLKDTCHSHSVLQSDFQFPNMESDDVESEERVKKRTAYTPPPKVDKTDRHISSQNPHIFCNGVSPGPDEDKHDLSKASVKPTKCEKKDGSTVKEENRRHKNKDKDSDNHKSTEQTKEQLLKETDISTNTKDNNSVSKNNSSTREKEKEREKEIMERERELHEKEKELEKGMKEREREIRKKEKEREKEREREMRETRGMLEEMKRMKAELSSCRQSESEVKRALTAALEKQKQLAEAYHKTSTCRNVDKAERGHRSERRARLDHKTDPRTDPRPEPRPEPRPDPRTDPKTDMKNASGECESERCKSARAESSSLKRELVRQSEQIRTLEACQCSHSSQAALVSELQGRVSHLDRALSAETRVKLDLLSALGAAKRHITLQEGLISRQEKELEELKAQMLAVMPTEYIQNLNYSALDPNASSYTPRQLLTDA